MAEPGAIAVTYFARGLGAANAGDRAAARSAITALATVDADLAQRHVPIWAGTVHAQLLAASAWLALAGHDTATAVRLATEAAELEELTPKHPVTPGAILPARELLGDMLLAVGRPAEARPQPGGRHPRGAPVRRSRRRAGPPPGVPGLDGPRGPGEAPASRNALVVALKA